MRLITLKPDFYDMFSCVAGECEDSCCKTKWDIYVDKNTYRKYDKLAPSNIKLLIDKHIKKNKNAKTEKEYAKIDLGSNNQCPMLDEQGLCVIHKHLGEDYLNMVCFTYPRIFNYVDDILMKTVSISCPEASRIILRQKHPVEFELTEEEVNPKSLMSIICTKDSSRMLFRSFWDILKAAVSIIQNRKRNIEERLLILGMLIKSLNEENKDNVSEERINIIVEKYLKISDENDNLNIYANIPDKPEVQVIMLKNMLDARSKLGVSSKEFAGFIDILFQTVWVEENGNVSVRKIKEAEYKYFEPFINDHDYMFENYIVYTLISKIFPFGEGTTCIDSYCMLVIRYALIKIIISGLAMYKGEINEETVIKIIQSFSKCIDHDQTFISRLLKELKEQGFNTLAYMAVLLK